MRLSFDELDRFRKEHAKQYIDRIQQLNEELDSYENNINHLLEKNKNLKSVVDGIDMRLEGIQKRLDADGLSIAKYVFGEDK